jgi:ESCRT-II complex subunit
VEEGAAGWVGGKGSKVQALLYWLKPEEWANMISNWVPGVLQKCADGFRLMKRDKRTRYSRCMNYRRAI